VKYDGFAKIIEQSIWNEERVESGFKGLRRCLKGVKNLSTYPIEDVKHNCFTDLGKSAGFNKSGAKTKNDIPIEEVMEVYNRMSKGDPCLDYIYRVGFRSHLVKREDPDKTRIIVVTPGPIAFVEKIFAHPFQEAMMSHPHTKWGSGWAWDRHGGQILQQQFKHHAVSLDFKGFDFCAPTWLIEGIFEVISESFELSEVERQILDSIVQSHLNCTGEYADCKFKLSYGVRTGSSFTHILGTLISMFLMEYCGVENYKCYGDDVVAEADLGYLRAVIGLTSYVIHPQKSCVGIHWLGLKLVGGRWYLQDPESRIAKLFLPEPGKRPHSLATRIQASILNSGKDPLAERLIKILEDCREDAISDALRDELRYWGRTYHECTYVTIRQLYDYVTSEFV
jgi:hypothetical protein